jgi:hypothetical protein
MANWKERINVEVLLPFDTPNCTTSWYWVMFSIAMGETWYYEDAWFYNAGDYVNNAPFRLNIIGKANLKSLYTDPKLGTVADIDYTTHKLMACRAYSDTCDPRNSKTEHFKVRYVSRDVELSDDNRRSMRLHSIDYGGGRIERRDR